MDLITAELPLKQINPTKLASPILLLFWVITILIYPIEQDFLEKKLSELL